MNSGFAAIGRHRSGRRPQRYLVSEGFDVALCIAELADSASVRLISFLAVVPQSRC